MKTVILSLCNWLTSLIRPEIHISTFVSDEYDFEYQKYALEKYEGVINDEL